MMFYVLNEKGSTLTDVIIGGPYATAEAARRTHPEHEVVGYEPAAANKLTLALERERELRETLRTGLPRNARSKAQVASP